MEKSVVTAIEKTLPQGLSIELECDFLKLAISSTIRSSMSYSLHSYYPP